MSARGALILPSRPGRSRRARTAACLATSLGPSSTRSGTPRISQSLNFHPGLCPSRSSSMTRMFAFASSACNFRARIEHRCLFFVGLENRNNHDLIRRQLRRQHQPLIVAVHHDDRADEARRKPPRSRPAMLQLARPDRDTELQTLRQNSGRGSAKCPACSALPSPIIASIE